MNNNDKIVAGGLVAEVVDNGGKRFCMLVDWGALPVGTKVYSASTIAALKEQVASLEAARFAYASEFALLFGEPDVSRIHTNIRALKEQLAGARNAALEEAAENCELRAEGYDQGDSASIHIRTCAAAIRALASQPAAPVQPEAELELVEVAKAGPDAIRHYLQTCHATRAAPPVQQPDDVRASLPTDISAQLREFAGNPGYSHGDYADVMRRAADECERFYGGMMAWKKTAEKKDADWNAERMGRVDDRIAARQALATTRPGAELVSLVNAAIGKAFHDSPVNAIRAQEAIKPFLPELTRPGAALTETTILDMARAAGVDASRISTVIDFARAILAASGGAEQVVENGWQAGEPPQDAQFLAYHPSLVHEDFNPLGVVEACFNGEEFIGAVWNGTHDCWDTLPIEIEQWCLIAAPVIPSNKKEG